MRTTTAVAAVAVLVLLGSAALGDGRADPPKLPPPAAGRMDFARDIRPILERSCLPCHATPEVVVTMNRARNRAG